MNRAIFKGVTTLSILVAVYLITALWLAVYAFNAWVLTGLFLKYRHTPTPFEGDWPENDLPPVTVQLPIFNEALVIERLIEAVARLDYPAHLLQIQVLDDSTDDTTEIALAKVVEQRQRGVNIELLHRSDRTGFKAGALKAGLATASGEFIAVFDADFVPEPDFLRQTIPPLLANPQVGFVQTRWGHLNRDYSLLTATQALAVDGHFVVEQTARQRGGLIMGFNGTGGVWRRSCIEAAGGWQGDTIAEDLDLSYRAQLAGWQPLFLPHVVAPAEIPPQLAAFKRQQFRWAKGSIQCLKKLGWQVLRAPLPWVVKWQALVHLSSYLAHPLMVLLAVITPILMLTGGTSQIHFPLIYLSLLSMGPPVMYAVAQMVLYPTGWRQHYKVMPLLIFLGGGIALSNTRAVVEAMLGIGNVFRRTPKFNLATAADRWQSSAYRLPADRLAFGELALGLYSLVSAGIAAVNGNTFAIPFILLYAFGFGYVGLQGVWETRLDWQQWLETSFRRSEQQAKAGSRKPVGAEQ